MSFRFSLTSVSCIAPKKLSRSWRISISFIQTQQIIPGLNYCSYLIWTNCDIFGFYRSFQLFVNILHHIPFALYIPALCHSNNSFPTYHTASLISQYAFFSSAFFKIYCNGNVFQFWAKAVDLFCSTHILPLHLLSFFPNVLLYHSQISLQNLFVQRWCNRDI